MLGQWGGREGPGIKTWLKAGLRTLGDQLKRRDVKTKRRLGWCKLPTRREIPEEGTEEYWGNSAMSSELDILNLRCQGSISVESMWVGGAVV